MAASSRSAPSSHWASSATNLHGMRARSRPPGVFLQAGSLPAPALAQTVSRLESPGGRLAELRFPLALRYRVLDDLCVEKRGGADPEHLLQLVGCQAERSRERHARLLHDPARGEVVPEGHGNHALRAEVGEALADQSSCPFGGVPHSPHLPAQSVAELRLIDGIAFLRSQMKPAQKSIGCLIDCRPEAVA